MQEPELLVVEEINLPVAGAAVQDVLAVDKWFGAAGVSALFHLACIS